MKWIERITREDWFYVAIIVAAATAILMFIL